MSTNTDSKLLNLNPQTDPTGCTFYCVDELGNDKKIDAEYLVGVSSGIKKVVATLSSAEILAGTSKEIIEAPGVGKFINILGGTAMFKKGSLAYTVDGYIALSFGELLESKDNASLLGQSLTINVDWSVPPYSITTYDFSINNKTICVQSDVIQSDGNGTFEIVIYYTIEDY